MEPEESSSPKPSRSEDDATHMASSEIALAPDATAEAEPSAAGEERAAGVPEPTVYADLIAPERVDADAVKVLRRLTRSGYSAYLVGGGVRDLLLGRQPK